MALKVNTRKFSGGVDWHFSWSTVPNETLTVENFRLEEPQGRTPDSFLPRFLMCLSPEVQNMGPPNPI